MALKNQMHTFHQFIQPNMKDVAVAVSGGPDSMALLHMLSDIGGVRIQALTVDHGLRAESAREAKEVGAWVSGWPNVEHHILKWTGSKPKDALMERAREARYRLMHRYCARHGIPQLWLAHQRTDQAETFLFRLAKGSGVDGLGAMAEQQVYKDDLTLVRPLLNVSKSELEAYCLKHKIPFVTDPTNVNGKFARTRLRQSLPALEAEGLTEKRLAVTAKRMQRAREALDFYARKLVSSAVVYKKGKAEVDVRALMRVPMEIRIRAVRQVLAEMGGDGYGPRLERLEELLEGFFADVRSAKRFTLGGFLFSHDRKRGALVIQGE